MRRPVHQQRRIESTEDLLALMGRAMEDMEQARRCQQLGADYTARAETRVSDAQKALIALTAYPYGREPQEVAA